MRSSLTSLRDGLIGNPWVLIVAAGLAVFAVWVMGTRSQEHHVRVAFDEAISVSKGLDVQANGIDVGKVSDVEYADGQAIVELGIDDERVWPLRRGATAALRYGTTVGNGTRRVDITPGPVGAPDIPDGGIISARRSVTPTEFDQVFQMLDAPARDDIRGLARNANGVLRGRAGALGAGTAAGGPALESVAGVLGDLASDEQALKSFVTHTDGTVRALASRRGRISALMTVGAATFDTFARNSEGVRRSLDEAPSALAATRTTLARLDSSIDGLDELFADLGPGARALRPLAARARPALAALRELVPQARDTVRTARRSAPEITTLLQTGAPLLDDATPVLRQLAPVADCLRSYAPELGGFFGSWPSFSKNFDGTSHYARVRVVQGASGLTDTPDITTKQFLDTIGIGNSYAGLRPPGMNAGTPFLRPECGVGADAIDPGRDWEDRR